MIILHKVTYFFRIADVFHKIFMLNPQINTMKQEKSSDWNIKNAKTQSREVYIALRLCVFALITYIIAYIQLCTPSEVAIAVSIAASV